MALHTIFKSDQFNIDLTYHRIFGIHYVTNVQNCITVLSYRSKNAREEERDNPMVFKQNETFFADYDPSMTIEQAYKWLKNNVDKFKNAEDILDDDDKEVVSND